MRKILAFLLGILIILPCSVLAGETKLDVEVYKTVNTQGNPIQAQPNDNTDFMFYVTWVHTLTTDGGQEKVNEWYQVGTFIAAQDHVGSFPEIFGTPYEKNVQVCTFYLGGLCLWYDSGTEVGEYVIRPVNVPNGYCPLDPYQTRKSNNNGNSPTVVEKFYFGEYCKGIGYKTPTRPQILIQ